MYVMDELTYTWWLPKNPGDSSLEFPQWWEKDLKAMVDKDFNHPSVILYSLGNEISETALEKASPSARCWWQKPMSWMALAQLLTQCATSLLKS
jgi:beta-galactosidase